MQDAISRSTDTLSSYTGYKNVTHNTEEYPPLHITLSNTGYKKVTRDLPRERSEEGGGIEFGEAEY